MVKLDLDLDPDLDPDPDSDPHLEKLLDPDPHKVNADPQPWFVKTLVVSSAANRIQSDQGRQYLSLLGA